MASAAYSDHRRDVYMPLNLKHSLSRRELSQTDMGRAVRQMNGRPLSRAAVSLIVNFGQWPKNSPRHSIEEQIRAFLRAGGVPEEEIASAFDLDAEAQAANKRPPPGRAAWSANPIALPEDELHVEPEMLSPQARRHFRLFKDPFNTDPEGAEDVFRGPDQAYASEALWEAVRNNRLFALVGESGSGKTTLLDDFRDRVRRDALPVRLIQPDIPDKKKISGNGILEAIVRDLDPHAPLRRTNEGLARQAHQLLADTAEVGSNTVILFEEAHDLPIYALKLLKRFHEFKTGWKRLLAIVLIAQPELMTKLGEHAAGEAREVARRLETVTLLPLDGALEDYVAHRLARAGVRVADVFADDAWDAVRSVLVKTTERGERVSMSYPLLVHNLLTKALNAAAELGAPRVDGPIVRDAFKRVRGA